MPITELIHIIHLSVLNEFLLEFQAINKICYRLIKNTVTLLSIVSQHNICNVMVSMVYIYYAYIIGMVCKNDIFIVFLVKYIKYFIRF